MKPITKFLWFVVVGMVTGFGCSSIPDRQPVDEAGIDDPLVIALVQKDYSSATRLLKRGYPVGGRAVFKQAPAYWAITEGDVEALRLLVKFGLDVNYEWGKDGGNLLINAVQLGHLDQVQLLCESGASLLRDAKLGRSPLYASVIYDHKPVERYLRDHGARFNEWDIDAFRVLRMTPQEDQKKLAAEQPASAAGTTAAQP
jgi:ankyrin repeat protein